MEIPLSSCGFERADAGLYLECKTERQSRQTILKKALKAPHMVTPRVINVDKNVAYPAAVKDLKTEKGLPKETELRPAKVLNNQVEQDHRHIKRLVKPGLGFGSFKTARYLKGYKAMAMIRKGQIQGVGRKDITRQISFIYQIFGIAA